MKNEPLAYRMRPQTIDDVISQEHLVGPKAIIRRMVNTKKLTSMIFMDLRELEKRVSPKLLPGVLNINLDNLTLSLTLKRYATCR